MGVHGCVVWWSSGDKDPPPPPFLFLGNGLGLLVGILMGVHGMNFE